MSEHLTVGISDMKIGKKDCILTTYALGSCIGLTFYDAATQTGALLHIMLPLNMEAGRKSPLKYADTGIRLTLQELMKAGALRSNLKVKIAGGAKMFEIAGGGTLGSIGQRNIESVRTILRRENIPLLKEDVGGTIARTMILNTSTGVASIRSYGRGEVTL
ncbi:MAG: chemotaxis protein CheD [Eubacteriales bacterium]